MVVSDPEAAKHVLRGTDNPARPVYEKGLVAEVAKFLFGEGFAIAGALHCAALAGARPAHWPRELAPARWPRELAPHAGPGSLPRTLAQELALHAGPGS